MFLTGGLPGLTASSCWRAAGANKLPAHESALLLAAGWISSSGRPQLHDKAVAPRDLGVQGQWLDPH